MPFLFNWKDWKVTSRAGLGSLGFILMRFSCLDFSNLALTLEEFEPLILELLPLEAFPVQYYLTGLNQRK
jgi:hypothetical protein